MSADGADAALRRFERDAVGACLVLAVAALVLVTPWRGVATAARAAGGVLGGGLLTAISYRAIKGAATALVGIAVLSFGRRAFLCVKFFTRYALLAVAAYVMLTCLRLHPVGLLAGATAPFVAALMQVVRMSRPPHS